jgi:cephalosporin hydroxylase
MKKRTIKKKARRKSAPKPVWPRLEYGVFNGAWGPYWLHEDGSCTAYAEDFAAQSGATTVFNEDRICRNDIPKDVFGLIHDLAYDHEGRDRWQYRDRAQALLSRPMLTPTQETIAEFERSRKDGTDIINAFHKLYYHGEVQVSGFPIIKPINAARFLGMPVGKCPLDLWVYQEILFETRPDLIIEAGSGTGASAWWLASICEILQTGGVVSVDTHDIRRRPHPRIIYLNGDILSAPIEETLRSAAQQPGVNRVMIIFDDDHNCDHVLAEMEKYCDLVTPGCYMCVEDSDVGGHPVYVDHGPGPYEALTQFLQKHPEFDVDWSRYKFLMTTNPLGYLVRY